MYKNKNISSLYANQKIIIHMLSSGLFKKNCAEVSLSFLFEMWIFVTCTGVKFNFLI